MNCENFNHRVSEFADNEMTGLNASEMRTHMETCKQCAGEFLTLQRMSKIVASSPTPQGRGPSWEVIAARLDFISPAITPIDQPLKRNRWAQIATLLSLAAALLLAIGLPLGLTPKTGLVKHAGVIAIDLQSAVELFASSPEAAVESLANKYAGEPAHFHQAPSADFKPLASKSLPTGVQLVSTQVMQMPYCSCPKGECLCGQDACNCVASICKRPDGSRFLIVENCKTFEVSFGDLKTEFVQHGGQSCEQMRFNDVVAVSWVVGDRHLTAIGLTDEHEADSLLAATLVATRN